MQSESKKIAPASAVWRAYWRHTRNYKWHILVAVFSMLFIQAGSIIGPLFLRELINVLSGAQSTAAFAQAFAAIIGFGAVQLAIWLGWRVEMFASTRACAYIMADLSKEGFNSLMHHSYQFFTSSFSGALTRRVGRYSDSYNRLWDSVMESVLPALLYTIGVIVVLWYQNVLLASALAGAVVLFIALQWVMSRWQQPLRIKRAEEDSNVTAALADSISNHNTVQLFSGNRHEESLLATAVDRLRAAFVRTWTFDNWVYSIQSLVSISINIGLLWAALVLWQKHLITIGDFVLIQTYFIGLLNNTWNLGRQFRTINAALADAGEMVYILELPYGLKDKTGAQPLTTTAGNVTFKNVSFTFNKARQVFASFNLAIAGGEKVAFVGPSGAGKSTITKLLLRLYDIDGGRIEIDGQNIAEVTQESLRSAIAFVPQEPILFHRTLMENIRYGRRDATDAEVIEAAKKAHCHEFISELPFKYETFVGERGIKLSGGERQRVAIARALLKNAPILVLDEATSSLDSESEALIQDALETLMHGKTVMVIAHRLSTIMKMDRIVVIEGGKAVAEGTHEELLKQEGLYHKLWSIQAGGFIGSADETNTNSIGGSGGDEEEAPTDEVSEEGEEEEKTPIAISPAPQTKG